MKKIVIAVLLFLGCLVPLVSAEVLFNDDDRLTLDILAANSDVKNGTLIGAGLGQNQRLEYTLTYSAVHDSGVDVNLIVPGVKYYLLRPETGRNSFVSVAGEYLFGSATSGSGGTSASGIILSANAGLALNQIKGYKIYPYAGLKQNLYDIGGVAYRSLVPRLGIYVGLPLGGGSVVYLKGVVNYINNQAPANVSLGYQFALRK